MSAFRVEKARRGKRFLDIFLNPPEFNREVKEGGLKFDNLWEYLNTYHGYRHFDLVAGTGKRIDGEMWFQIRRRGPLERFTAGDRIVWSPKGHVDSPGRAAEGGADGTTSAVMQSGTFATRSMNGG